MRLNRLILKNFLTYEDFEYTFENRPLLIQGLNLTDDDQKTNGTGKSGLQTGIEFCITASNSRDVRDSELITYGCKEGRAELFASCDARKETLHIAWILNVKGSNQLSLKTKQYGSEDWIDVKFSTVNDGKKYILDWFAISKEDLFNYFIINKTKFTSFFKSSNKEKIDLINRFSDASIIEGLDEIDKEELEAEYLLLEKGIFSTDGKIELLNEQILREKERDFKAELAEEKESIEEEIEEHEDSIEDIKKEIQTRKDNILKIKDVKIEEVKEDIVTTNLNRVDIMTDISLNKDALILVQRELKEAEKLVAEFKATDFSEAKKGYELRIKSKFNTVLSEEEKVEKIKGQETQILKFIQKIEVTLSGIITCPKCKHEFVLEEDVDVNEERKKIKEANALKETLEKSKESNNKTIAKIKEDIKLIEEAVSAINKNEEHENKAKNLLISAINEITRKVTTIEKAGSNLDSELKNCDSDIKDYETAIRNYETSIKNIEAEIVIKQNSIKNIEASIKNLRKSIKGLEVGNNEESIKELNSDLLILEENKKKLQIEFARVGDEIYLKNQWINNFKQFKMYLANQSLEVIEFHCNRYLNEMGSDLTVKLDGFKILANGKIKDEITASVIRNTERTFSSFSGGERGRLLFAAILANRHMINATHPYGGFDFLSIDEVFEGVDALGLRRLLKSAKALDIPVMIITHVTDEVISGDVLLIVKENGISRIQN